MFTNLTKVSQDGIVLSDGDKIIYSNAKLEDIFDVMSMDPMNPLVDKKRSEKYHENLRDALKHSKESNSAYQEWIDEPNAEPQ